MFTNNYYKALATQLTGGAGLTFTYHDGTSKDLVVSTNSTHFNYFVKGGMGFGSLSNVKTSQINNESAVIFGNGTAKPTLDDYKLAGNIISGISTTATKNTEKVDGGAVITMLYNITNTSSSDITISEIGYFGTVNTATTTTFVALLDRTVLDTPVTIPVGGIGQVTYTIRMNYPTV